MERIGSRRREVYAVLVLGALFFPTLSLAATVTYASNKVMGPTNGLVGYWTMNAQDINWTTNTILDRSGMGNNGTFVGMATKTAPTMGKIGQGLKFLPSPTKDYLNMSTPSSLNNLGPMTVSAWVYTTQTSGTARIIQKSQSPIALSGWYIHLNFTGGLGLAAGTSATSMGASSNTVTLNKGWHHVVVTWDGGIQYNGVRFYVDGTEVAVNGGTSSNGTGTRGNDSGYPLTIGGYPTQTTNYHFDGTLDEVRIYNRVLTPTEVKQLYGVGQVKLNSVSKKNTSGLVGWWTFDAPDLNWTTGVVLDRSGYGNNGTMTNMATKTSPVAGKMGQGLDFTGGSVSWVQSPPSGSLNNLSAFTYSAWIHFQKGDMGGHIIGKDERTSLHWSPFDYMFTMDCSSSNLYVVGNNVTGYGWHHVVATWNGGFSTSSVNLYRDGVRMSLDSGTNCSATRSNDIAFGMRIGNKNGESFSGVIDDVRVYNRSLTSTEVAQLYKQGQVTINSFTCGVSTVKDVDGNVYHTVKIGTQCWMKENMRVGTRINGATNQTNNGIIEKYCYSDTAANCTTNHPNYPDGGLYQWDEAMQYSTTPGAQGICPAGWHIPTHDQFTTLERAVCTSGSCVTDFPFNTTTTGERGTGEEFALISGGSSGFEMNIAGKRSIAGGSFMFRDGYTYFWSSTDKFGTPWFRRVTSGLGTIYRDGALTYEGYSVRCLQN